jgi:toluene monooxygenase electron transfer component
VERGNELNQTLEPQKMFKIKIADTAAQFDCADNDTVLRSGLRAFVGMPYECNVGSCGTCKMEIIEGQVEALWEQAPGLNERDKKRGRVLACQSRPKSDCTVRLRPGDEYKPMVRPHRFEASLIATADITHDIREFRFRAAKPAEFLPGQYALMTLPAIAGLRAYSMSIGEKIKFDGPYGLAYLRTQSARDVVCIAGGSGLSPVISIARGMAKDKNLGMRKLHFFYGGRGPQDVCGEDLLRQLPGFGERTFYYPVISMPELDTEKKWRGKVGFAHELVAQTLGASLPDFEYYFAGPPPMVQAVQTMLMQHKVPLAQIHFDRFF